MVTNDMSICPKCSGDLKPTGCVKRIVRLSGGRVKWIKIRRLICTECGVVHRELPEFLLPYKHYDANIIRGVVNGNITPYDLEYEDYPAEITMERWKKSRELHALL